MNDFTKLSLEDFLDQLSDRTPTPGGGGVAATAGALACSMARMVAAYSINKRTDPSARTRVEELTVRLHRADELLRALITQDARAYQKMTEASKSAKDDESKRPAYAEAILAAIAVPMEIAATASNALAVMDDLKVDANRYLLSDLGVAAVLSDATARASRYSVKVNLTQLDDHAVVERISAEIDAIARHCDEKRDAIEAFVNGHLE